MKNLEINKTDINLIGTKAYNLERLKKITQKLNDSTIIVPSFITISPDKGIEEKLDEIISKFSGKKVAIRSSSPYEDTDNSSQAGAYETILNIDTSKENIVRAYNKIQKASLNKFGYKIPVVVQEMVDNIGYSGVIFSQDPDTNKPYVVINYHNGVGEDLVSGLNSGKVEKYLKIDKFSDSNWKHKLVNITKKIEAEYGKPVDIEFAIDKNGNIYLLQVRPITTIFDSKKLNILTERYSKFVVNILSKHDKVLGNMIDVNPEELVGNESFLAKTFFYWLFLENALKQSRLGFGYGYEYFGRFILDKPYIDLEKNLVSFLPDTLTDKKKEIFIKYYKELIRNDISRQKELDSKLYPINLSVVEDILNKIKDLNEVEKRKIKNKFIEFFKNLEKNLPKEPDDYFKIEKEIFEKIGVNSYKQLITLQDVDMSLNNLLNLIIFVAKNFADFARAAFYWNGKGYELTDGFKNYFYLNQLEQSIEKGGNIQFSISNGFNFLETIKQEVRWKRKNKISNINLSYLDVGQLGRDNFKFIMFNLFRILRNKIIEKLKYLDLSQEEKIFIIRNLSYLSFKDIINLLSNKISFKRIKNRILHNKKKEEIRNVLELPPVVDKDNNMVEVKKFDSQGYFIGKGLVQGEVIYIKDLSDIDKNKIKGKILLIKNATPEIDFILPYVKAVVTKHGGPLAHIVIRAREYKIPAIVGMGNKFEEIKDCVNLKIDFKKGELTFY